MTKKDNPAAAQPAHSAYVHAVVHELERREIAVTDVVIAADEPMRAAMTVAEVDPMNTAWHDAGAHMRLLWNERSGWQCQAKYPGEEQPRSAVHFGVSAVPPPNQVAAWMSVSLVHPETAISREDGPFETPDLEIVLQTYAMT